MKDVGGVAETRSLGWRDGIMHTGRDEGHFYSPPPPTSGDKNHQWTYVFLFLRIQDHIKMCYFSSSSPNYFSSTQNILYLIFQKTRTVTSSNTKGA